MKKCPVIILLIAALFVCCCTLNAFELSLKLKTIIVTLIVALFCGIRIVISLPSDDNAVHDDSIVNNEDSSQDSSP